MADRVVELMNELLAADPVATRGLLLHRVVGNDALACHPTIQVGPPDGDEGMVEVGIMGVLNGLCGVHDDGPRKGAGGVCYDCEGFWPDIHVLRFRRLSNGAGE